MVLGGIRWTARHWWLGSDVAIHIHGGPTLTLSFMNLAGIGSIIMGPFVYLTGQWMLKRATAAAKSDPITAAIFDQPAP